MGEAGFASLFAHHIDVVLSFLALGMTAQLLSFNAGANLQVSLDSAFYVAAIVLAGPVQTAWIAAVATLVDTFRQAVERRIGKPGDPVRPLRHEAAALIYNSGTAIMTVLIAAALIPPSGCGVDTSWLKEPWPLVTKLPLLTAIFLSTNYAAAIGSLWTQGNRLFRTFYKVVLPSMGVELMLIPLSVVLTAIYDEANPFLFVLMGVTFLLFNLVVKKVVSTRAQLQERVNELKSLNAVGTAVGSSLQLDQVLETVMSETLHLVPNARISLLALNALAPGGQRDSGFTIFMLERYAARFRETNMSRPDGLLGYISSRKEPLLLKDARAQGARFGKESIEQLEDARAFVGVPMVLGDECIGVLAVISGEMGQFDQGTKRLLVSIANQAAVAVQNARLFEMATQDGLTELFVRRYFDQRLEEEWHRARRYGSRFTVILSDLDDFKEINDQYGHQAGDLVLKNFSQQVIESMRANDIAARYGGEEFAMLLPRANTKDAVGVAERLRIAVAAMRINFKGTSLALTASFGIAGFPEAGMDDTTEDIFRKADLALYKAKSEGKNRVEVWTKELEKKLPSGAVIQVRKK